MEGVIQVTGGQLLSVIAGGLSVISALFFLLIKEKDGRREDGNKYTTQIAKIATDSAIASNNNARALELIASKIRKHDA